MECNSLKINYAAQKGEDEERALCIPLYQRERNQYQKHIILPEAVIFTPTEIFKWFLLLSQFCFYGCSTCI